MNVGSTPTIRSMLKTEYITGSSEKSREPYDFYSTPPEATKALLDRESFPGLVWEPACGSGAMSEVLETAGEIESVVSSDICDRGFGMASIDFLSAKSTGAFDHIITNPPYGRAQEFIEKALSSAKHKVAMLLKLNFLEGQKRAQFFKEHPPARIYVFSKRLSFNKGDEKSKGRGLLAYAWYVWEKGFTGDPTLQWI